MSDSQFKEKADRVADANPEALLADGFEQALLGYVERFGQSPLALYDRDKCIEILMLRDRMSYNDAVEFFEFNTLGAWMGENTPAFASLCGGQDGKQVPSLLDSARDKVQGVRSVRRDQRLDDRG